MANEFAFMFINIEDQIAQYKEGMISEQVFVDAVQRALDSHQGELATIEFNEPGISDSMMDGAEPTYEITKL